MKLAKVFIPFVFILLCACEVNMNLDEYKKAKEQLFEDGHIDLLQKEYDQIDIYLDGTSSGMIPDTMDNIEFKSKQLFILKEILGKQEKKYVEEPVELTIDILVKLKDLCFYQLYGRYPQDIAIKMFKEKLTSRLKDGDLFIKQVRIFLDDKGKAYFSSNDQALVYVVKEENEEVTVTGEPKLTSEEQDKVILDLMEELKNLDETQVKDIS